MGQASDVDFRLLIRGSCLSFCIATFISPRSVSRDSTEIGRPPRFYTAAHSALCSLSENSGPSVIAPLLVSPHHLIPSVPNTIASATQQTQAKCHHSGQSAASTAHPASCSAHSAPTASRSASQTQHASVCPALHTQAPAIKSNTTSELGHGSTVPAHSLCGADVCICGGAAEYCRHGIVDGGHDHVLRQLVSACARPAEIREDHGSYYSDWGPVFDWGVGCASGYEEACHAEV